MTKFITNNMNIYMKNRLIATISSLALIFVVVSCSKKEEPKASAGALDNLPAWVIDPSVGVVEGVAGVGIASPSAGGIKFQIPKAEMDAKANIASTIQTEISRVTKNALREANVNKVNDVEEFFAQATKEVVKDLPLSGVKRLNMFQAEDGSLYIRMVLNESDYSKFLQNSERTFAARLKQAKLGRDNIDASQKATAILFDELEKERKSN